MWYYDINIDIYTYFRLAQIRTHKNKVVLGAHRFFWPKILGKLFYNVPTTPPAKAPSAPRMLRLGSGRSCKRIKLQSCRGHIVKQARVTMTISRRQVHRGSRVELQ